METSKHKKEIEKRNVAYEASVKKAEKQCKKDQALYNAAKDDPEKRIDILFSVKSNINL